MTPRTIEVTEDIRVGRDTDGLWLEIDEGRYWGRVEVTRPDLEKLRAAIGELLEEEER